MFSIELSRKKIVHVQKSPKYRDLGEQIGTEMKTQRFKTRKMLSFYFKLMLEIDRQ